MMNQGNLIYIIEGDPVAWARAVPSRKTGRMWDSQKQTKLYFQLLISRIHGTRPLYDGPLHLDITYYLPIPPSLHKKADKLEGSWHFFRPDKSNLLKLIEDAATGILYKDDCLICSETSYKKYSKNPRTEFIIRELHDKDSKSKKEQS